MDFARLRPLRFALPGGETSAELLQRCFSIDVLSCPGCGGRMRLMAMVTEPKSIRRFLRGLGETTDPPLREPARGPLYWKSRVLRRQAGEVSVA